MPSLKYLLSKQYADDLFDTKKTVDNINMNLDLDNLLKDRYRPSSIRVIKANYKYLLNELKVKQLDFNDIKKIEDLLKGKKNSTIRNYFTSLTTILSVQERPDKDLIQKYRKTADKYDNIVRAQRETFQKTDTQKDNWVSLKELKAQIEKNRKKLIENKGWMNPRLTKPEFMMWVDYLVPSLYLADPDNAPRRGDYANMRMITKKDFDKLTEEQKEKHNWLVRTNKTSAEFVFYVFKTSSHYEGGQTIPVSKKLNAILNIWDISNPSDKWLLPTFNGKDHISTEQIARILKRAFADTGKAISINMIRNIFVSEHLPPIDPKRTKIAYSMGHKVQGSLAYSKN